MRVEETLLEVGKVGEGEGRVGRAGADEGAGEGENTGMRKHTR
jgi:hypothetical protein